MSERLQLFSSYVVYDTVTVKFEKKIKSVTNRTRVLLRQNSATGDGQQQQADSASSPSSSLLPSSSSSSSSLRQCPVMAAFYENITTPWSADKYVGLCSITATSRVGGRQRRRLVYTSTSSRLYIHVVNVTGGRATDDHVLLRYDGRFRHISAALSKVCGERNRSLLLHVTRLCRMR